MSRTRVLAACAILVAAVVLAHGGAVRGGFVFDDELYVTGNPQVLAGLSQRSVAWAFGIGERMTYYHPFTWLSLMLDRDLLGPDPGSFHAVNVALHALVTVLLFLALASASGRAWPSLAAALLFAVHPLTVEGVAWIAERKTVLSGVFGMGAVLAHVAWKRAPSWQRIALVTLLQAASLLAKPGLVVLPALLLALDFWPLRRVLQPGDAGALRALRQAIVEKLPLALVSAASLAVSIVSVRYVIQPDSAAPSFPLRAANALAVLPRYLGAALWPTRLALFHPYPEAVPAAQVLAGAALLVAATVLAVVLARSRPWLLVGWIWFLAALSPYLGFKQAGLWPAWADRFAYVPLMGLAVAVAFEAADVARRARLHPLVPAGVTAAAAAALALATHTQVGYWRDREALYRRAVEIEPASAVMRRNLGSLLLKEGRYEEARPHLVAALPRERQYPEVAYDYARLLESTGDREGARRQYLRFLEIVPRDHEGVPLHVLAGGAFAALGQTAAAEDAFRRAAAAFPQAGDPQAQLGFILMRSGRYSEAVPFFEAALRSMPDVPELLFDLAEVLRAAGNLERARPYYARFAQIAPPAYEAQRRQALAQLARYEGK